MACEAPLPPGARSACPIANTLDVLGDKWTLLVIRDLFFLGKHRFGEFLASPEGIPTNILTDRLRRLEEHGIVTKVAYSAKPQRYEYHLTAKGTDLLPVLRAMVEWATRHLPGIGQPPPEVRETMKEAAKAAARRAAAQENPAEP
jgi:DNA-binding HxlR family transcriptional regulator